APVEKLPIGVRSAALNSDTLLPPLKPFVTRILWPSKAAWVGPFTPLPESVATTAPVAARTTVTVSRPRSSPELGAQMLVPSNAGNRGVAPTLTVCRIAPFWSSFSRVFASWSVTQMLEPSNRMPVGPEKPALTLVTGQGVVIPGVMIDTEPPEFAVQMRQA